MNSLDLDLELEMIWEKLLSKTVLCALISKIGRYAFGEFLYKIEIKCRVPQKMPKINVPQSYKVFFTYVWVIFVRDDEQQKCSFKEFVEAENEFDKTWMDG